VTSAGLERYRFHDPDRSTRDRHLPGFVAEDRAFLDAVAEGSDSPLPLSYAVRLQKVVDTITGEVLRQDNSL
jgi:hypothetical protein